MLSVVILAAGQGTRMRSDWPKVLHPVGGRPMLRHVIDTARQLQPASIHIVYGSGGDAVREAFPDADLYWCEQAQQLGTGDAVRAALPAIPDNHRVLVLCGDVPIVTAPTLQRLLGAGTQDTGLLTLEVDDPTGYGRIRRDDAGQVAGIVEDKDADDQQRAIREINTGLMVLPAGALRRWLDGLSNDNAQGEYYLTDVIGLARADGYAVHAATTNDATEVQGINNRIQLAAVERAWQRWSADRLMREGVTLTDPARVDVRGSLSVGTDCVIDANVILEGEVVLGRRVHIGPGCVVRDSQLDDGVTLDAHTVAEGARLREGASAGPFARLRKGTDLGADTRVGNFVETKSLQLGEGSKANHLSYLGDATVGAGVNIGAGTITCNYDGRAKHQTAIEDGAFIGSDTQLVAPVTVGRNATIGAGTTVRRDAPAEALTISSGRQRTVPGWSRPTDDPS